MHCGLHTRLTRSRTPWNTDGLYCDILTPVMPYVHVLAQILGALHVDIPAESQSCTEDPLSASAEWDPNAYRTLSLRRIRRSRPGQRPHSTIRSPVAAQRRKTRLLRAMMQHLRRSIANRPLRSRTQATPVLQTATRRTQTSTS
jgi:hypothetical protein